MGEYDDLAAKYGVGKPAAPAPAADDPFADLAARYLKPEPPSVVDMGPSARRARAGGSPSGPRDITAEEAGTMAGPTKVTNPMHPSGKIGPGIFEAHPEAAPADAGMGDSTVTKLHPGGSPQTIVAPHLAGELDDPIVQAMAAGSFGRVAGVGAGSAVGTVAPRLATVAAPLVEGGVASKAAGGDFTTGALLTGTIPALKAGPAAVMEGAPARVNARMQRALTEPATQKMVNKLTQAFGPDGEKIIAVADRNPEMRKALAVMAEDRPKAALDTVQEAKGAANASRNADVNAMQAHYANVPPSGQATISGILDDYTKVIDSTGATDLDRITPLMKARTEIMQAGDRLRKAQGLPPAVNGDYSGTVVSPKDLRKLEETIGRRAFDQGTPQTIKQQVNADLYGPLAKQMNALAENAPGVDAKRFAQTGQDIHVMIPVEEALQARVSKLAQGKKSFWEHARDSAHYVAGMGGLAAGYATHNPTAALAVPAAIAAKKVAGALGRRIDYQLAEAQLLRRTGTTTAAMAPSVSPAAVGVAAGTAERPTAPGFAPLYLMPR